MMKAVSLPDLAKACAIVAALAWAGACSAAGAVGSISLNACTAAGGPGAECGTLAVPVDRSNPALGSITLGFAIYPHGNGGPSAGTALLIDGGPGYASAFPNSFNVAPFISYITQSSYDVLLIDQRGTGSSGAIKCSGLQSTSFTPYTDSQLQPLYAACAATLGVAQFAYGSQAAADDVEAVRQALGIPALDVYGVSYGTLLAETYATRHPGSLRSLVLDGSYLLYEPPTAIDLWQAFQTGYGLLCQRDDFCSQNGVAGQGQDPISVLGQLVAQLNSSPISGPVATGRLKTQQETVSSTDLAELALNAGSDYPMLYRELAPAAAAALAGDPAPLLRLKYDYTTYWSVYGSAYEYSAGQDAADVCVDYPYPPPYNPALQPTPYDPSAPVAVREAWWETYKSTLPPGYFGIFSTAQWLNAYSVQGAGGCTAWPSLPAQHSYPLPQQPDFPNLPTLFLHGDVDDVTSLANARQVYAQFQASPSRTNASSPAPLFFTTVLSMDHDLLEYDVYCGPRLAAAFILNPQKAPSDACITSGRASRRIVPNFALTAAGLVSMPQPLAGDASVLRDRQAVAAAVRTLGDAMSHDDNNTTSSTWTNPALRSGSYSYQTAGQLTRVTFNSARFVNDITVNGSLSIDDPQNGSTRESVSLVVTDSTGVSSGNLQFSYSDSYSLQTNVITVTGTLGGRAIRVSYDAP
jgi:pimeloyl-ACP methyl ester carboxylesterase